MILRAFGILLAAAFIPRLPDAIPARELRTHADTTWLVGAAAQALPYRSILSAGANSFPGTRDPADADDAGDRARLAIVAWALEVPFDSADVKAPPPVCPSDSAAPHVNGYRMEHVRIVKGDSMVGDRSGWFHYIVKFTRACWTQGKIFQLTSDVRFDAARDTGSSYVWRVGWVRSDPDPIRPTVPRTYARPLSERFPNLFGFAVVFLLAGPVAFPVFAYTVARDKGPGALPMLLGIWSVLGAVFGLIAVGPALVPTLLMFVTPAVTYVAAAGPASGSTRLRFGRATVACLGVYVICVVLWFVSMLTGIGMM